MPFEVTPEQLVWIVLLFFLVIGVWLIGLTYLMWKTFLRHTARAMKEDAPSDPTDAR